MRTAALLLLACAAHAQFKSTVPLVVAPTTVVLALLYGCRAYFPLAWLDIPWMRAVHGTANALGFGLAGVLGWTVHGAVAGLPSKEC